MAHRAPDPASNLLYYGDNLDVLRDSIASESVDLVYLDPPFNSNRAYSVLFKEKSGNEAQAQMEAFDDTWTWSHESERLFDEMVYGRVTPGSVRDALAAFRKLLGDNDVLAYLVMMTARLVELHRVLKPTGSLYLHCDPTASHYLKVMLDAIFGGANFRSEITWKRSSAHSDTKQGRQIHGHIHDVILWYTRGDRWTWNPVYTPYDDEYVRRFYPYTEPETGRRYGTWDMTGPGGASKGNPSYEVMGVTRYWRFSQDRMAEMIAQGRVVQSKPGAVPRQKRYLDESVGIPLQDLWTDIPPIAAQAAERLGYPTQKPIALLERILATSSNPGDVVLDPFCGCGTTVDAAQKLGRRWVGIDITTLAVDLIDARLRHTYGEQVRRTYEILGIPRDLEGAQALFHRSPFEFERWVVMQLDGQPNLRQVGDKGVDGIIRFPIDARGGSDRVLVSVKGGATNPGHVRDLLGTIESQHAAMGVFVSMHEPTRGMVDAVHHSGSYRHPANGQTFPKLQILTVAELLHGKRPEMPPSLLPYFQAMARAVGDTTEALF